jgi:SAM-dependent methyltransferase
MYKLINIYTVRAVLIVIYRIFLKISKIFSRSKLQKQLRDEFAAMNTQESVLFIGSGGALEKLARARLNPDYFLTIDIDKKRSPDIVMSATEMSFEDKKFDLVLILEVLEHIDEPQRAVEQIYRVLKPGGKVICSTPFVFGIHDGPSDFYRFTRFGLQNIFSMFQIDAIEDREGPFVTVAIILSRLIISRQLLSKLVGAIFCLILLPVFPLLKILDSVMPADVTSGYLLIATKSKK